MKRVYEPMAYGPRPIEGNFWNTTVPKDEGALPFVEGSLSCDVAVVGGGYTGLSAALNLAEAGADVVLVDAKHPAWGASGRNGGFCCLGGAKLDAGTLERRYGPSEARSFFDAERLAVETVAERLERHGIAADTHSKGETMLAHRSVDVATLEQKAREINARYGVKCEVIPADGLAENGMASSEFHGAITTPIGFALNPLKYALGLEQAAISAGARIFGSSPVTAIARRNGRWRLQVPHGTITARTLLMATNGYSSEDLPDWMAGRYMPVQSNILVTRPLTEEELAAQGWTSHQMCYDTRNLLHYFRLMPDRRMLFGLRGAVRATEAAHAGIRAMARADFDRIFPAWRHVETPFFWSGLVAISRDFTPFAGPMGGMENAYAAMCYHGNGVAMGSYAGTILAGLALGQPERRPYPELMRREPRRIPFGQHRRMVLPFVNRWYRLLDSR
ncbi:NAD(P)/FAD-dependent oxidoreductase [Tropicimonas isoalkanivorans]|uniref:Glycine/D-amino acid oxidase n=1 Tax=Tropicimonas isoalkanivorans TaxID=441112 RepID=A0A1I1JDF5_9RHOB|nr:FAD-binding oxidoreductase [Tropicimonas isoalkanivorans]SFC46587.1 Glycine/D-amino acid oxidase [Tropicimonas isoalkanivorans]